MEIKPSHEVTSGHSGLYPKLQPSLVFIIYLRAGRKFATQLIAWRLLIKKEAFLVQSGRLTPSYGLKAEKTERVQMLINTYGISRTATSGHLMFPATCQIIGMHGLRVARLSIQQVEGCTPPASGAIATSLTMQDRRR